MEHPDYNSPSEIKAFLESQGMAMQKKFGQNFLLNQAARKSIIAELAPCPGDCVWEVGPGLGCMTEEILKSGANLTAFEIDRGFARLLHEFFTDYEKNGKFRLVQGDVLKGWKGELLKNKNGSHGIKLFGNLPYNIAATFVADTITEGAVFARCVFTVQKEVALRMAAQVSSQNYSAFSVLCQKFYTVRLLPVLGAGNFWPRPNVASQSVLLTPIQDAAAEGAQENKLFVRVVHSLFSSRRKTVANNIRQMLPSGVNAVQFLEEAGIDPESRAENLSARDFTTLSRQLHSAILAQGSSR